MENIVIKVIVKKLIDCYKIIYEMGCDLLIVLSLICYCELKFVFNDIESIKILFKVIFIVLFLMIE